MEIHGADLEEVRTRDQHAPSGVEALQTLCHRTSLLELTQEERAYQMSQGLILSLTEEKKALLGDLFTGKLSTLT